MQRCVRLSGVLVAIVIVVSACSDPLPTSGPPDSELRLQIHAATGHEPPECTDFGASPAEIEITPAGFEPDCLSVAVTEALTVSNHTETEQRFIVGDPANSEVGRHIRVDEVIAAGESFTLDVIDTLLDEEIYPFWLQGLQEQGYAGSLVISP